MHERTRWSETPGVENGRSARARLGFRGFGSEGEVESRPVHRARRRDARYDEAPSSRPVDRPDRARAIDRRRSREGEGSRTQKRGRRRFSRVRRTRGLRVTHPRLCSCPCRSRRRRPCWTRQLPSRPSSPPWSSPRRPSRASRPSARSPRKEGFDSFADCAAGARERRRRRGRVRSRTGSRRRAGEYRGASTERGDVHRTRTERGGTCERLCVWAAPTLLFHTQREWKWNFSLRVFCRDEQWTFSTGKR